MYQVTKTYGHDLGLSTCFRQWRAKSHCSNLHGYALSFKLTFGADELDENLWVIDFGSLKPVKAWLFEQFDHKTVVAADDYMLGDFLSNEAMDVKVMPDGMGTGCEMFARYVFGYVNDWLVNEYNLGNSYGSRVWLVSVECREHGANSAIAYRQATHDDEGITF